MRQGRILDEVPKTIQLAVRLARKFPSCRKKAVRNNNDVHVCVRQVKTCSKRAEAKNPGVRYVLAKNRLQALQKFFTDGLLKCLGFDEVVELVYFPVQPAELQFSLILTKFEDVLLTCNQCPLRPLRHSRSKGLGSFLDMVAIHRV